MLPSSSSRARSLLLIGFGALVGVFRDDGMQLSASTPPLPSSASPGLPGLGRTGPAGERQDAEWTAASREIVELVRDNFYQPEVAVAWAKTHIQYADGVKSAEEFNDRTRKALAELRTSHTNYYPADEPEAYGLAAIFSHVLKPARPPMPSIGADIHPEGFLRHVFVGGPADKAGLRRGDKIVQADGRPLRRVRSFDVPAGHSVTLLVQKTANDAPVEVRVVPRPIQPKEEWIEAQRNSARIFDVRGKKVAYMHLFSGAGVEHQELVSEAIAGKFASADALVLDFRDGWGGCNPDFVNLFNRTPPVLEQTDRDGRKSHYDPQWRKRLVLLVNPGVRSGKEVVAHTVQKAKLGTLVGQRTAGAVVAGRPFVLKNRAILVIAATDVRVNGERLEGVGVAPDIEVEDHLPYARGSDPQRDRALEEAAS